MTFWQKKWKPKDNKVASLTEKKNNNLTLKETPKSIFTKITTFLGKQKTITTFLQQSFSIRKQKREKKVREGRKEGRKEGREGGGTKERKKERKKERRNNFRQKKIIPHSKPETQEGINTDQKDSTILVHLNENWLYKMLITSSGV